MLATAADELPRDPSRWSFEFKWDGVRAITVVRPGHGVRVFSRNGLEATAAYPELQAFADALDRPAVLDGEVVALDAGDRPSFPLLQRRMHVRDPLAAARLARDLPVFYAVFDVLWVGGRDVTALPLIERRELLEELTLAGPHWRVPPAHVGDGAALLEAARQNELEGIVAKRLDSVYVPGRRSPLWVKLKLTARQEFVVGGWVPEGGDAASGRIGALLLGYYDCGKLRYAGGVGTGFAAADHARLSQRLARLSRSRSPFAGDVPKAGARFVDPTLVAEVEFRRWPAGGLLHQASYHGLRPDKNPTDVVREDHGRSNHMSSSAER